LVLAAPFLMASAGSLSRTRLMFAAGMSSGVLGIVDGSVDRLFGVVRVVRIDKNALGTDGKKKTRRTGWMQTYAWDFIR